MVIISEKEKRLEDKYRRRITNLFKYSPEKPLPISTIASLILVQDSRKIKHILDQLVDEHILDEVKVKVVAKQSNRIIRRSVTKYRSSKW